MRWSLVAVALVLSGCGVVGKRDTVRAPLAELEPAPPIVAVDEAPPYNVLWFDDHEYSSVHVYCDAGSSDPDQSDGSCPALTPEQEAKAREQEKAWNDAVRPAPGSDPRTIAKLRLSDGGTVLFIAWHNAAGELCTDVEEDSPDRSGGGGGPGGPCVPDNPTCGEICVESGGSGDVDETRYTLTGFVPSEADSVRVTIAGGVAKSYPLTGPVVEGTDRRVLMLELGRRDWRRIEVFRGDELLAAEDLSATIVAYEDCEEKAGPMPIPDSEDDPALKAYEQTFDDCLIATMPAAP
jgi:hypothetical protein